MKAAPARRVIHAGTRIQVGLYEFGIQAILANASVIPLLRGTVDVAREP
jgi:hypothetical protein